MGERLRIEADLDRFEFHGEFDLADVEAVQQAFASMDGQSIVVDLAGVTFVDSAALRCLVVQRELHPGVRYVNPSPQIVRLAGISGMAEMLFGD